MGRSNAPHTPLSLQPREALLGTLSQPISCQSPKPNIDGIVLPLKSQAPDLLLPGANNSLSSLTLSFSLTTDRMDRVVVPDFLIHQAWTHVPELGRPSKEMVEKVQEQYGAYGGRLPSPPQLHVETLRPSKK